MPRSLAASDWFPWLRLRREIRLRVCPLEVLTVDGGSVGQENGPAHTIFEFAHVAAPGLRLQSVASASVGRGAKIRVSGCRRICRPCKGALRGLNSLTGEFLDWRGFRPNEARSPIRSSALSGCARNRLADEIPPSGILPTSGGGTRVFLAGIGPSLCLHQACRRNQRVVRSCRLNSLWLMINNSYDFGVGRRLHNPPKLREISFAANRRVHEVQTLSGDCSIGFEQLQQPARVDGQRASALRF
jgi:hypothetical protein